MRTRSRMVAALPHIDRIARWNLLIAIAIGTMVRASLEFSESDGQRPDGLFVLGFFLAMAVALFGMLRLRRAIAWIPGRPRRVTVAVMCFLVQAVVLQVLVSLVAP